MKFFSSLFLAIVLAFTCVAAEPIYVTLWPDGALNAYEFPVTPEQMQQANISDRPFIKLFEPDTPSGKVILCCPGGGYQHLAVFHEGSYFADWLNSQGITLAVLTYRMPYQHTDAPLSDVHRAMSILRDSHPGEKVGIMGFSAGGHLASTAATHFTDSITRPDFQILFYPVISMDAEITHGGTRRNLLGETPAEEMVNLYSGEKQVTAETPAAFIIHCTDDPVVPVAHALRYAQALADAGVSTEMLIFPTGGHGWGFNHEFPYFDEWTLALSNWLGNL